MKKNIIKTILLLGSFVFIILFNNNLEKKRIINNNFNIQELRKKHAEYLDNSPYKESLKLTKKERKARGIPPNKYYEEQWELTMNPRTGFPEPQNILDLQLRLNNKGYSQKVPGEGIDNTWEERGPNNVGGRTRVVIFDPNDPTNRRVFAGGVSGGLWFTNDIEDVGSEWIQVQDVPGNMNVSCLTIDPRDSNIWYIGTGELYTAGAAVGNGVYKTTNGGLSWSHLPILKDDGTEAYENNSAKSGLSFITNIIARDNGIFTELYLGVGFNYNIEVPSPSGSNWSQIGNGSEGLYKSINNGDSWTRFENEHFSKVNESYIRMIPNDIVIGADNTLWMSTKTSIRDFTWGGRVYKSIDGGNWTEVNVSPLPNSNRVELAVSATNPNKIYALAEGAIYLNDYNSRGWDRPHIYVTEDGFETITELALPNDADEGISEDDFTRNQAYYNLVIEVDPENDDIVYVGGIDLFRSERGIQTANSEDWKQISKWSQNSGLAALTCSYVHADQHAFLFHPTNSNKAVIGCDGGVFYATDLENASNNDAIVERNKGYNVTQFYYGDIGQSINNELIIAGAQDNGTQFFNGATDGANSSIEIYGGDGVFSTIDDDGDYMIASYVYNNYYYFKLPYDGSYRQVSEGFVGGKFVNPAALDNELDILFSCGGNGTINRSILSGEDPKIDLITNKNLEGFPTALKVVPNSPDKTTLIVGTIQGRVFKAIGANLAPLNIRWIEITGDEFLGSISDIEFGSSENEIFVTMYNYGVKSIWYTMNGGKTWHNKEGDLPDLPVRCILQNPFAKNEVIIGTELGVWRTDNFNESNPNWLRSQNGMKDVKVVDLDLRNSDGKVLGTTHGRGVFTGFFTQESKHTFTITTSNSILTSCNSNKGTIDFDLEFLGGFSESVQIEIEGMPERLSYEVLPTGNNVNDDFTIEFNNINDLEQGEYLMTVKGVSNSNTIISDIVLKLVNSNISKVIPSYPENGAIEISALNSNVTWIKDEFATYYEVEISDDPTFGKIVERGITSELHYSTSISLENSTTYFWRVRSLNDCKEGEFSDIFYFRTQTSCQSVNYWGFISEEIEEGLDSYLFESELEIYNDVIISDLNIDFIINYINQRNIDVSIVSPKGTEVKLYDSDCDHKINYLLDITYDDQATNYIECGSPVHGTAKPFEPLSAFNGESSKGIWTLKILIHNTSNLIQIFRWGIEFCTDQSQTNSLINKKDILVEINSSTAITQNYVKVNSIGSRPSEQVFMITELPKHGVIKLNSKALSFGQTFTQQDINNGKLIYQNSLEESQLDNLKVNIINGTNGFLPNQEINIVIDKNFKDDDKDGIRNELDQCLETVFNVKTDANGCYISEYDNDEDGYNNDKDKCNDSPFGSEVDRNGCVVIDNNELWGISGRGLIFKYNYNSNKLDSVSNLHVGEDRLWPASKFVSDGNGNLFGTTTIGGQENNGIIFKYDIISNVYSIVHEFNTPSNGINPSSGGLIWGGIDKLYGSTVNGGNGHSGVMYEYDVTAGIFNKLANFPTEIRDKGVELLLGSDGLLYGATYEDYTNKIILFQFDLNTNEFTILFKGSSESVGEQPIGNLFELNDHLYGVNRFGGKYDEGTIFRFDLKNKLYTDLYHFDGESNGGRPVGGLVNVSNNTLLGITDSGGYLDTGIFYKYHLESNQVEKIIDLPQLMPFSMYFPFAGRGGGSLLKASNEKIYGFTTRDGYLSNEGVIFEYDYENNIVKLGAEIPKSMFINYDGINKHAELVEVNNKDYDRDQDLVLNNIDNCIDIYNPDQNDLDNDGIGDACDRDIDGDGVLNDEDNCVYVTNSDQNDFDEDGIGDVCDEDIDGDGVMNEKDLCQDTSEVETVDENGCSQSQLDNDNDGVINGKDLCPGTPEGEIVNSDGCILLASNNFKIETINETCPNKNNGQIKIETVESYNYLAIINGSEYSFTNNLTIENLKPDTYTICLVVPNVTSNQCYTFEIAEGEVISGKASTTANKTSIKIDKGTAPFDVFVNGKLVYKTLSSTFDLNNKHGDLIEVKTAIGCEGVFSKTINLFEDITVYPNPTKGIFEIALPLSLKEVKIELFTINSQFISGNIYQVNKGKVQLDIKDKPVAMYIVKIHLENPVFVKIIKE